VETNEMIEKVQKLGELVGTLSVVVYAQSCFIEALAYQNSKVVDAESLALALTIQRQNLRQRMKSLGMDDAGLDELDTTTSQFEKYQKSLAEEQEAFKKRRELVNREYRTSRKPR
jgi:hypothetical protein